MNHASAVLAIDQGTTGTRAILYGKKAELLASAYQEFPQIFPRPGWVEHDAEEIWQSVLAVAGQVLQKTHLKAQQIAAIGITNQRETTILWDKKTGRPVHHAIVWQDRRTSEYCAELKRRGYEKNVRRKTGLVLDPYFSATKISWLLKHVKGLRKKAEKGGILFGTIDTWLLWKMTGGRVHATDYTNASRTLLFNIRTLKWDPELLKIFQIPQAILPAAMPSAADYGVTEPSGKLPGGIPIRVLFGDQQAALYGQSCYRKGDIKNTYGTGCFTVFNLGSKLPKKIPFGLLATVAADQDGKPVYALEGSVFIGGAVIQWVRDGLHLIRHASETEAAIHGLHDTGGVTLIPAFAGLGSPHWNPNVRGVITGLTRGTTAQHLIRAALESIAQQSADVIEQMQKTGTHVHELRVDGGATKNHFLMQFQADLLRMPILVSEQSESTAWGAAKLAAHASGFWSSLEKTDRKIRYKRFIPKMKQNEALKLRKIWQKEVQKLLAEK
jgi:glycerol kinase